MDGDATLRVALNDNTTIRFDNGNESQPDALLAILAACGGQSRLDEDDYIIGPPVTGKPRK